MKRRMMIIAALAGLAVFPAQADAQQNGDENALVQKLSECVALKTTGEDRLTVARWMIGAFAMAPQMQDVVSAVPAKKIEADQGMARLFTRLLTVDCAAYAGPLLKGGRTGALEVAGGKLGEIAIAELLTSKEASNALEAYADYLNEADFKSLRQ